MKCTYYGLTLCLLGVLAVHGEKVKEEPMLPGEHPLAVYVSLTDTATGNKLSLNECIELALYHHPEIRNLRLRQQISAIDVTQSKRTLLPNMSFGANHGYNFGRSIDRFTNQFVTRTILTDFFSLNANMTLYQGGNLRNTIKHQQYNYEASGKDMEAFRNQLSLNVANGYLALLLAKELTKQLQSQVGATQLQVERAQKLVAAGSVDRGVVLGLESQLAQEELALTEANNQFIMARIQLEVLMVNPPDDTWDIIGFDIGDDPVYLRYDTEEVYQQALNNLPEVTAASFRVKSAQMMEKAGKGLRVPNISMYANMSTVFSENAIQVTQVNYTGARPIGYVQSSGELVMEPIMQFDTRVIPVGTQLKNNFGQTFGVSLSWNIFNGSAVESNIKRSVINTEIQQNSLEQIKNNLKATIARAVADYEASVSRVRAQLKAYNSAKLQMDFAEKRFESGLMNYFEYINIKNQMVQSEINYLQSRYQRFFNETVLKFYSGELVF
jgi:outer membrane protein